MWSPTHVHVIVHSAQNLLIKGKHGTNNSFVVIELGKESYRTSVREKSEKYVTWNEECELKIPKAGNKANLVFTAFHKNGLGLDQFLGTVKIPLQKFDKYERTIKWYTLGGKSDKQKSEEKKRGEVEIEIGFLTLPQSKSMSSISKTSTEKLTGSLFGFKDKSGMKKLANSFGRVVLRKKKKISTAEGIPETSEESMVTNSYKNFDPGVISDEDDDKSSDSYHSPNHNQASTTTLPLRSPQGNEKRAFLKKPQISISHCDDDDDINSYGSSINIGQRSPIGSTKSSPRDRRYDDKNLKDVQADWKSFRDRRRISASCADLHLLASPKVEKKFLSSLNLESNQRESFKRLSKMAKKLKQFQSVDRREMKRTVLGCEAGGKSDESSMFPKIDYKSKNKDELIRMVADLQQKVDHVTIRVKDLEDYLDHILAKVMESVPKILEKT